MKVHPGAPWNRRQRQCRRGEKNPADGQPGKFTGGCPGLGRCKLWQHAPPPSVMRVTAADWMPACGRLIPPAAFCR